MPSTLVLVTWITFLPSLRGEFLTWDDVHMFRDNFHYRGLGWPELRWMWTSFHVGEFMPLTWMTYGADFLLWGLDPFGYRLTNLVLHVLAVLVVYRLAHRLIGMEAADLPPDGTVRTLAAGLASALFALHPLRVEPVAWVSARGSILSGVCLLLAILAYLRAHEPGARRARRWWLMGSLGFYALALLSRSTAVVLPVLLLVFDVYPLRRLGARPGSWVGPEVRGVWGEKAPFVGLALLVVPLAFLARFETRGVFVQEPFELVTRLAVTAHSLVYYLHRTLFPGAASPLNETPAQLDPWDWPYVLSGMVALGITLTLVAVRRRWPAGLAAWGCYAVVLLPTSGILSFGVQLVADRYSYVSTLGAPILVGAGFVAAWQAWRRGLLRTGPAAGGLAAVLAVVMGLGVLSHRQLGIWRDSETLWTYALSVEPGAALPHVNLGLLRERDGRLPEAVEHYQKALAAQPADATIHTNLGRALLRQGKLSEAEAVLREAVRTRAEVPDAHFTLGAVLAAQGRVEAGIAQYRIAAQRDPDSAAIRYNLARAFASAGRLTEAIEQYRAALSLQPDFTEARAGLAQALEQLGASRDRHGP